MVFQKALKANTSSDWLALGCFRVAGFCGKS